MVKLSRTTLTFLSFRGLAGAVAACLATGLGVTGLARGFLEAAWLGAPLEVVVDFLGAGTVALRGAGVLAAWLLPLLGVAVVCVMGIQNESLTVYTVYTVN